MHVHRIIESTSSLIPPLYSIGSSAAFQDTEERGMTYVLEDHTWLCWTATDSKFFDEQKHNYVTQ